MRIEGFQINQKNGMENYTISRKQSGEIVITRKSILGKETDSVFTISREMFEQRKKKTVFANAIDEFIVIADEEMNRSRDLASFLEYQKMVRPVRAVFNIYFHDSYEDSMVFFIEEAKTQLPENEWISHNKGFWLHDYLAEQYPDNSDYLLNNIKSKHDLLVKTNPIDSITALEQQVDLLTEIVKRLVNNEEQPTWSNSFINEMITNSSQSVRPVNKIIEDLISFKSDLRVKVAEYLSKKS